MRLTPVLKFNRLATQANGKTRGSVLRRIVLRDLPPKKPSLLNTKTVYLARA